LKNNKFNIVLLILFLVSCKNNSVYKGYTQTDSGLYYKLITIGDGKRKAAEGDYLQLRITYKTDKDSTFLDTYSANAMGMVLLPLKTPSFTGSFEEGLTGMTEGDSVSFIVNADNLFKNFFKAPLPLFLKQGSAVKIDMRLNRIFNQKEYEEELSSYQNKLQDLDIEEQRKLTVFMDTSTTPYTHLKNGIYYLPIKQGAGDLPQEGDVIKVNYTGSFLNGKVFESTYKHKQPLEYTCGEQGQVIKGLEIAINLMNEGAKAKFIIPSCLAYGESGSSTGIVPSYTPVIYEVELLNLTKK
jgi:FKBP-type peptidyl-prolyl cis-trans isomerase FkpA